MQQRRATMRPHPVRDQIVDVMRSYGKPISPTQLSRITGGTLGSVAYHVRTLTAAGVVELSGEGRVRGAVEHFYVLSSHALETDRLTALLSLCQALTVPGSDGDYPRPATLDEAGREDLERVLAKVTPQVQAIAAKATRRVSG